MKEYQTNKSLLNPPERNTGDRIRFKHTQPLNMNKTRQRTEQCREYLYTETK